MIKQINNRQNGITWAKKATTAFAPGILVEIDSTTGFIQPASNTYPVLGLCNEKVDVGSTTNDRISISEAVYNDEFEIPVTGQGAATALMEGRYLALDTGGGSVTIVGISQTCSVATPILVLKYINDTTIIGKIAFRF